jgi:hypothetical protein
MGQVKCETRIPARIYLNSAGQCGFDDCGGPILVTQDKPLVKPDVLIQFGLLAQKRREETQDWDVLAEDRQADCHGRRQQDA